jgi:hypothetical protein
MRVESQPGLRRPGLRRAPDQFAIQPCVGIGARKQVATDHFKILDPFEDAEAALEMILDAEFFGAMECAFGIPGLLIRAMTKARRFWRRLSTVRAACLR